MLRLLFVCLSVVVAGCVSATNVPKQLAATIPDKAEAIKLYFIEPPTECYRTVYRALAAEGFGIDQENQDMGTFSTEYKDVGQQTTLKINIFIDKSKTGSVATLRGQWAVTSSFGTAMGGSGATAEAAVWGKTGRPSIAFGEMAVIADKIPHDRIEYVTQ